MDSMEATGASSKITMALTQDSWVYRAEADFLTLVQGRLPEFPCTAWEYWAASWASKSWHWRTEPSSAVRYRVSPPSSPARASASWG